MEGVKVRRQTPKQQQIPFELKELHLVQVPSPQAGHGAADVPELHEPLPKAPEGRSIPQGHGFVQVFKLLLEQGPFGAGIGTKRPLSLPAQGAQGQKPVQHEVKACILLLLHGQFHSVFSMTFITGTLTLLSISRRKASGS